METSSVDLKLITSLYKSLRHNENVAFSPFLASKALGKTDKNLPQDPQISLQLDANNTLSNTIYFTQTSDIGCFQDEFTTSAGEIIKLDDVHHAMKPVLYSENADLKATVTSFRHKGSDCLRLFMIMPDQDSSMEELERRLENTSFENIVEKLKWTNVFSTTPMFKFDTNIDLAVSEFLPGSGDDQTRIRHKVSFGINKEIVPPKPIHGPLTCSGIVQASFAVNRPVIFFVACMSSDSNDTTAIDDILIFGKLGRPLLKSSA